MLAHLRSIGLTAAAAAALSLGACNNATSDPESAGSTPPPTSTSTGGSTSGTSTGTTGSGTSTSGTSTSGGTTTGTQPTTGSTTGSTRPSSGSGSSIPTLVSVNLQNVLNDLSVQLNVNRNNIPVTAQVPVEVAASVCGVSVSALSASIASGTATCTAKTGSPQLTQAVQQQIASGGSVTGGDQTMGTTPKP